MQSTDKLQQWSYLSNGMVHLHPEVIHSQFIKLIHIQIEFPF